MSRFIHFSACVCLILSVFTVGRAQKPELVVQTGHNGPVTSVAFSPDGKTLASGSFDNTVKLWDALTGTALRTLDGHSNAVASIAFSPDGKTLASASNNTVKLWDVSTGTVLRTLDGSDALAFSPDGKTLASGRYDKTVKLWDVLTGTELRSLAGHSQWVYSVVFSPDGKTLASGSSDKTIKLWDVSTGTELRAFVGHSDRIEQVAFTPDGKTLASGSLDNTVKLWNVSTGTELRTLKGHSRVVTSVAFSPDGKTLGSGSYDKTVKLWDVSTGTVLRTIEGHSGWIHSVAFSPDGKTLASGNEDISVGLWDVSNGTELPTFKGHSFWVYSVTISPDGKTLASGSGDNTVKLWDVSNGTVLHILKGHSLQVISFAFSPDGKTLASGSYDKTIKLWDVSTLRELRTLKGHSSAVRSVAFGSDGKTLASGSADNTVKLWNVSNGTELQTLKGHSDAVHSVAFSPDGQTLASGSLDNTVKLWNVSTSTELRALERHSYSVRSVVFSPDGKTLASGSDAVKLWNGSTGTELRTLRGHSYWINSVAFSPDGKTLASGGVDKTVRLWDVSTGKELHNLKGHSYSVSSVEFSLNDKYLLSGAGDTTIKVWEVTSGKELATLIAVDEHDWVVVTPDGLFDGSPAAWNKLIWRFNNNTFNYSPVEAFFDDFYYPGLLTEIIAGKRPKAQSDISQKDRRQPRLKLTLAGAQHNAMITTRNVSVKIDVSQAPAGAQDVRLFRNGSLVRVWRGDVLKGQSSITLAATIPIVAGDNRLLAYAFNRDNIKSSDATLVVTGADSLKRQGTAYVLAVGVNTYSNSNYNLKYAVPDAEDFSAEIKRQQDGLKKYERVEVISLYDKDATKLNILQKLSALAKKAQPEDAVIVYFSGHGTAAQQHFYLIPHDLGYPGPRTKLSAADLKSILDHSISDRELEAAFEKIDAGQLLMVIDACNSGQALDSEEKRRGPMNSKGLAQLAYEKGMYILTAAQSYQAAWEASRLGHGYLTYALIEEGLKQGTADREPKNNEIVLREWLDFATDRVPQMQEEKLKETPQKKDQQGRELEFVFIEGDESIKDPAKRNIQRPRVFYRRELESSPLIIARPQAATPTRN